MTTFWEDGCQFVFVFSVQVPDCLFSFSHLVFGVGISFRLRNFLIIAYSYKANISDTEAPFLDLHLSAANGFVSSKIYDKRDDFDFDIVNFPFLDGDVPRRASYGVYISQLIRFARVCNHVTDSNARNKSLTAKLLQQGYRYHKLRKTFF